MLLLLALTIFYPTCCQRLRNTAVPEVWLHALSRLQIWWSYLSYMPLGALNIYILSNITIFSVIFSSWILTFILEIPFILELEFNWILNSFHINHKSIPALFLLSVLLSLNWSYCRNASVTKAQTSRWRQHSPLGNQGFLTRKVRRQNTGLPIANTSAEISPSTETEGSNGLIAIGK